MTNGQMESSDDLKGGGRDATGVGGPHLLEIAQHLPPPSR
jgi:hypothetical protein